MKENLNDMINMFLFSPENTYDEYIEEYKNKFQKRFRLDQGHRYSNLFFIRKDIRHCLLLDKAFNSNRNQFSEKYLASIVLLNIAITNYIKLFYLGAFEKYVTDFMDITNLRYILALRYLRNALEHSNYSLHYVLTRSKILSGDIYHQENQEIFFALGLGLGQIIRHRLISNQVEYLIDPRMLYSSFESSLEKHRRFLLDEKNCAARKHFEEKLNLNEWTLIRNS